MRACSSCGARNATDGTFCIRCGASLVDLDRDPSASTDALPVAPERVPDTLVDRAATQLADGDAPGAIANCRRAIALDPRHVEAHAVLGMAHEQRGDLPAALDAYDTVLGLAPDRAVERQKASLLRLRLGHTPPPVARRARRTEPLSFAACVDWLKLKISDNPPLAAGIAAAFVVFLVGSMLLVSVGRGQARAERKARYDQEIALARQALAGQQYAEATSRYETAWKIMPGDAAVRGEWDQAYRLSQYAALQYEQQMQVAAAPKYIANTAGRNPFEPVPIPGGPAVPPPGVQPGMALTMPGTPVPPPTVVGNTPAYETWTGAARNTAPPVPSPTTPPPSSRRDVVVGGNRIITPVTPPRTAEKPTNVAPDTRGRTSKGEITITMSPRAAGRAPTPQAQPADSSGSADAAALRARGEQLGREGNTGEAISTLQRAAGAYEDLSRRDPNNAAAHSQAAGTCRARIEILRQGNR